MIIPSYLKWIREQPCHVCQVTPSDPHHCGKHGTAKRNHDEDTIPLCRYHHRLIHDGKIKIENIVDEAKKYYQKWLTK
jgi:hypothetical protein